MTSTAMYLGVESAAGATVLTREAIVASFPVILERFPGRG